MIDEFRSILSHGEEGIDLALAALTIARGEYSGLNVRDYLNRLDAMALKVRTQLQSEPTRPLQIIEVLNQFLFEECGFSGNADDYYDPRNSYLNEVLDRHLGIPITLSVVYMELARRIGLDVVGVGLPGHFIVKPADPSTPLYIDPFNGGILMTREDCQVRVAEMSGESLEFQQAFLQPLSKKQILYRLLNNLKQIYTKTGVAEKLLWVIESMLVLAPDSAGEIRDRSLIHYQLKQYRQASEGFRRYLALEPSAADRKDVLSWLQSAEDQLARMN
jgi:regulator of sirC expression with transglutaminase-like and TPR domain